MPQCDVDAISTDGERSFHRHLMQEEKSEQQLQELHASRKKHQSAGRGWKQAMVCNIS